MVGVDPRPLTLRELAWMVRGKRRLEWSLFSAVLAKIHNITAKLQKNPSDFNPVTAEDLENG